MTIILRDYRPSIRPPESWQYGHSVIQDVHDIIEGCINKARWQGRGCLSVQAADKRQPPHKKADRYIDLLLCAALPNYDDDNAWCVVSSRTVAHFPQEITAEIIAQCLEPKRHRISLIYNRDTLSHVRQSITKDFYNMVRLELSNIGKLKPPAKVYSSIESLKA